jgi:Na+-translocating ferredoxin:NAD+ oxidoreductase subunit D
MKFITGNATLVHEKKANTARQMTLFTMAIACLWLIAMIYQGVAHGARYALQTFILMAVSQLTTFLIDILVASFRYQTTDGHHVRYLLKQYGKQYSYITAALLTLSLPIGTPIYVLIVANIFATMLVKYAFGGFGANIFNPAIFGRLFVSLTFGGTLSTFLPPDTSAMIPTLTTGATITSVLNQMNWFVDSLQTTPVQVADLWLGFYAGALGETFAIVLLAIWGILVWQRVINWRPTVFFLFTILLTTMSLGLIRGINPLSFSLIFIGSGSIIFGATMFLTDPVTSPTTHYGKALYGVLAAFLVLLFRFYSSYVEGVAFSIAIMNILAPTIDRLITNIHPKEMRKNFVWLSSLLVFTVAFNGGISLYAINANPSSSSSEPIGYYRTFLGTATTDSCSVIEEACIPDLDTITASIHVNERYRIEAIELGGKVATLGGWSNLWQANITSLLSTYQTLGIPGIQTVNNLPNDLTITGVTNSSHRLKLALQDALKTLATYQASVVVALPDDIFTDWPISVTVYVEEGVVVALDVVDGEGTSGGGSIAQIWQQGLGLALATYRGLTVQEIMTMTIPPQGATIIGATVSSHGLLTAIQTALEGQPLA